MGVVVGQVLEQEVVDGVEVQFVVFGVLVGVGYVVEDLVQFGGGEIWIDQQFGVCVDVCFVVGGFEFGIVVGGMMILLDDGWVDQVVVGGVLDQCGFVLVGDVDGGDVGCV